MSPDDIHHRFKFHPATTPERQRDHDYVRDLLRRTAQDLNQVIPDGREKSIMVTSLEEAMFWANAAIARKPD